MKGSGSTRSSSPSASANSAGGSRATASEQNIHDLKGAFYKESQSYGGAGYMQSPLYGSRLTPSEYDARTRDQREILTKLADGNYGTASDIAKSTLSRMDSQTAYMSEKQAYVVSRAALENGLVNEDNNILSSARSARVSRAREDAARELRRKEYNSTYTRSSTKMAVGSRITDSKGHKGTISKILTASSGYVEVKYDDGSVGKQMAFNLYGDDGNPLKKKPNR